MKIQQKLILTLPDNSEIELSKEDAESLRDSLVELLGYKKINNTREESKNRRSVEKLQEEFERFKKESEEARKKTWPVPAIPYSPPTLPQHPWETGPCDPLPGQYPIIWCSNDNKLSLTIK